MIKSTEKCIPVDANNFDVSPVDEGGILTNTQQIDISQINKDLSLSIQFIDTIFSFKQNK